MFPSYTVVLVPEKDSLLYALNEAAHEHGLWSRVRPLQTGKDHNEVKHILIYGTPNLKPVHTHSVSALRKILGTGADENIIANFINIFNCSVDVHVINGKTTKYGSNLLEVYVEAKDVQTHTSEHINIHLGIVFDVYVFLRSVYAKSGKQLISSDSDKSNDSSVDDSDINSDNSSSDDSPSDDSSSDDSPSDDSSSDDSSSDDSSSDDDMLLSGF